MQIKKLDTYKSFQKESVLQKPATEQNNVSRPGSLSLSEISAENIRAAYIPAFGQFKKVGETFLTDRITGEKVKADIKKEKILNEYIGYKLYVGEKVAGFMDMSLNDKFPKYSDKIPFERFPQIIHLRTLEGEKYSGTGTTLVKLASEESKKLGKEGALWLDAEKGYMKHASRYRSDESPIPFYYKLGFRAPGKKHKEIKNILKSEDYYKLPNSQILYLTPDAAEKL